MLIYLFKEKSTVKERWKDPVVGVKRPQFDIYITPVREDKYLLSKAYLLYNVQASL